MSDSIIIAHRGASGLYPENTLLSFRTAIEMGAEWIELDTQLVEDELVVFHDERLERTTDGKGYLSQCGYSELRQLDAGRGEQVPTLREVLELAAGRPQVNIELKGPKTAEPVAELLLQLFGENLLGPDDVLASSLRIDELKRFQQLMPQVRCAPVYEVLPEELERVLQEITPWSLNLSKSLITKEVIALAKQHSSKVLAWTVNDVTEAERLFRLGVDGIFTDYPERFIIRKG